MAIPKYYEFYPPFMDILSDGEAHTLKEIREYCGDYFKLSEEERNAKLPSGKGILRDHVGWARTHLKKAGLIENPERASFIITPFGRDTIKNGTDILTMDYINRLKSDKEEASMSNPDMDINTDHEIDARSPQEAIDYAMEQLKADLVDELFSVVRAMDEYEFEKLVVDLLVKMHYGEPEQNTDAVTKKSGDEGIDGIVKADRFGFDAIYTQAKRWKEDSHVGRPEIQKFLGAVAGKGATKGLFITTGRITRGARELAEKQLNQKLILVDGRELAELMIEYGLGVTTVATYEIKRIDTDYFNMDN